LGKYRIRRGRKDRHDSRNHKRISFEKKTFGNCVENFIATNWEQIPVGKKKYVEDNGSLK